MTETQKEALRLMNAGNHGAVVTKFGWTWPDHVRRSDEHAAEVVRVLRPKLVEPAPESEAFEAIFEEDHGLCVGRCRFCGEHTVNGVRHGRGMACVTCRDKAASELHIPGSKYWTKET